MNDTGRSGTLYYIDKVKARMWLVWEKRERKWVRTEAKGAALDCGAKGTRYTHHTHSLCAQVWP